jgi:hypothetical protein
MYRERTYICPVDLWSLDEPAECRQFLLRALSTPGVRRVSFVRRGGAATPLQPAPDEAMLVHASDGKFGRPAEERWGHATARPQIMTEEQ